MDTADVAIVGAGPAGLVCALLLARSGARVVALESAASFERSYRGEQLTPGTLRILADLGLREAVEAIASASPAGIAVFVDGRSYDVDLLPAGSDRLRTVPQPALLTLLAERVRDAGGEVALRTRFRAFERDANGRIAGLVASTSAGERRIAARLVVAADGRFSSVRRVAEIGVRAVDVPFDLVWMSGRGDGTRVRIIVGGEDAFIAFPTRAHGVQIGWVVPKGAYARLRERPFAEIRAQISDAFTAAGADIAPDVERFDELTLLPIVSERAARWSEPGLLLIGDAAHPMSPVAAQGINVAIADAVVAARRIAPALHADDRALDVATAAFARERAPSIARVARQQNLLPFALAAVGTRRLVRTTAPLAAAIARSGRVPALLQAAIERFLYGDPPVRADHGPWMRARNGNTTT